MTTLIIEILVLLIVGLLSIVEGLRLHFAKTIQMYDVLGPGLYNVGMGAILIIVGLYYFISQWRKGLPAEKRSEGKDSKEDREYKKMMISMILVMVAYIFLVDLIGYLFASVVFFFLINRVAGFRSWLTHIGVTLVMAASFYLIFVTWMGMIFPRGTLIDF